jgi:DNA-binding SARP family transcriptional activator
MIVSRDALVGRIATARPRLLRLVAPAGYGKTALLQELGARSDAFAVCDCRDVVDIHDLCRNLLAALAEEHTDARRAHSAADESVKAALALWKSAPKAQSLFVFEDVDRIAAVPEIATFLRTLLDATPLKRTVALTSRGATPALATTRIAPHEIATISPADLLFTPEAVAAAAVEGVAPRTLRRIATLACGWPIAVLMLAGFAREGRLDDMLERPDDVAWRDLQDFIVTDLFGARAERARATLLLCAGAGEISTDDAATLCAATDLDAVWSTVARFPLVSEVGGTACAHPVLRTALRRALAAEIRCALEAAVEGYAAAGRYARAAELLLLAGDADAAAAMLARYAWNGAPPAADASGVIVRLGLVPLVRHREVWLAALRHAAQFPPSAYDEAQAALGALAATEAPETHAALAVSCGVLARAQSRLYDAGAFFWTALDAIDGVPNAAWLERLIHVEFAVALAMLGRGDEAARRLQAAEAIDPARAGRNDELERTLVEIFSLQCRGAWSDEKAAIGRYIALACQAKVSPCEAYGYSLAIAHGHFAGDYVFEEWGAHRLAERCATDPLSQPVCGADALFRRVSRILAEHGDETALRRCVEEAEYVAGAIDAPVPCLAFALVASRLPGHDRNAHVQRALHYAREIEGDVFEAAVLAATTGEGRLGPLEALMRRISNAPWARVPDGVSVEILTGTVRRGGIPVELTSRSLELIVALALARTPLSRSALADRLWPELDGASAPNALKTCVHRTRLQVGDPNIIVYAKNAYSLGAHVRCDVLELEARFRRLEQQRMPTPEFCADLRALGGASPLRLPGAYDKWEWFGPHGLRIVELQNAVSMCLANVLVERGEFAEAIDIANVLLDHDSCYEAAAVIAVEAWLRLGNRSQATAIYRRYEKALQSSFGDGDSASHIRTMLHSA